MYRDWIGGNSEADDMMVVTTTFIFNMCQECSRCFTYISLNPHHDHKYHNFTGEEPETLRG